VEITTDGVSELTTACTCPAEEGMKVNTNSEKALEARRLAMELLLAKWPHSERIQNLAREMGIEKSGFAVKEEQCILCGLCVRTCHEIVEADAITFIDRGLGREIKEPHIEASSAKCIGCGSCVYVCPTGYIKMEEVRDARIIWDRVFKMKRCKVCGNLFAPEAQLEYIRKKWKLPEDFFDVCPNCR
jgi:NADH dehydrogenase/NADH:ubiquinone oxidoreductase subunit G